jgi:hypothetical protein
VVIFTEIFNAIYIAKKALIRRLFILIALDIIFICNVYSQVSHWTHFVIDKPLPGSGWGTSGPALGDFDGDGDLDVVISRREAKAAFWYEYLNDSTWIPHILSNLEGITEPVTTALGAAVLDIDHDGDLDLASNRVWFENPGNLSDYPDIRWKPHQYQGGRHDIIAVDINVDGWDDIVTNMGAFWFDTSDSLKQHTVFSDLDFHGGIAPKGFGDIDEDGDVDLVVPGFWFANPGKGEGTWPRHPWPYTSIPHASYGTSIRCWVVDLDNDGDTDIVYSDCDSGFSHVYWVENLEKGAHWILHRLDDPPVAAGDVEGTGSFHSLGVADFDHDGDLDIFAGEQEDPDDYMTAEGKLAMKPAGLKERGVIWENIGTAEKPEFTPVIIQLDNPGWHDASLGDVDGDGDIDIVSKVWNADTPVYHTDFWRNDN